MKKSGLRHLSINTPKQLPKDLIPLQRWFYYISGDDPHLCPNCGKFVPDFYDRFCCHKCSTLFSDPTRKKTGPKVDLAAKEKKYRIDLRTNQPDYKLIKYNVNHSTFKHSCGRIFDAPPYGLLTNRVKCTCLHKKLLVHTIETLTDWHIERNTGYTPIKIVGKNAKFASICGHRFTARKYYIRRCPKCYNGKAIFATRKFSRDTYISWLKEHKPEFTLIGKYKDHRTKTKYLHTCGAEFIVTPGAVTRKGFRCPACSPKTCGTAREYRINGRSFKLRGKEAVAVQWMLDNTTIKVEDIAFDIDKTVPRFRYKEINGKRTQGYHPDFYIAKRNLIVEVKDMTSSGLRNHQFFYVQPDILWQTLCLKAKAVIDAGYKFRVLVFNSSNTRVKLPKDWHTYSHKKILKWLHKGVK